MSLLSPKIHCVELCASTTLKRNLHPLQVAVESVEIAEEVEAEVVVERRALVVPQENSAVLWAYTL